MDQFNNTVPKSLVKQSGKFNKEALKLLNKLNKLSKSKPIGVTKSKKTNSRGEGESIQQDIQLK